jgi:hypothetical protein
LAEELVNARNDIPVNRESVLYIHDSFIKQELTVPSRLLQERKCVLAIDDAAALQAAADRVKP